ncbi:MAG: MFS transporter [Novosphingobium sp.]|nr:MFS transporter [Novosphingobium sp.]
MSGARAAAIIKAERMSGWQWLAVGITVGLNALDGFDVLSVSFAAPGIAGDWGLDKAALGWVLSMELLGMAVGSLVLGGAADRFGRRPTILACLCLMTVGMWGAAHAPNVDVLLGWRLLTGLGIGGMLSSVNAATYEVVNDRWRSVAMSVMIIGYPIGGVIGGLVVKQLLIHGHWRDIFMFGAVTTACFIPLVWFFVPETVAFLERRRAPGALERINRTLARFGHGTLDALGEVQTAVKHSFTDILRPGLLRTTLLITLAYFGQIMAFYYMLKWVPKIIADTGYEASTAAGVLVLANLGGALGGLLFGFVAMKVPLKALTIACHAGSFVMTGVFGMGFVGLAALGLSAGASVFFATAAITGIYMLFARVFPTHVRATGTGFALGVGRGGSMLAPVLAGYLFEAGYGLQTVSLAVGSASLMSIVALLFLKAADHAD